MFLVCTKVSICLVATGGMLERCAAHLFLVVKALEVVLEVVPTCLVVAFGCMEALQYRNSEYM